MRMVFLKKGATGITAPVFVFSVADAEAYKAALLPNLTQTGQANGVTTYSMQQGFGGVRTVAIGLADKMACVGSDGEDARLALELVNNGSLTGKPLLGDANDLAFRFRVKDAQGPASAATGNVINIFRSHMMNAMAASGQQDASAMSVINIYLQAIESFAGQVREAGLKLNAGAENLKAQVYLDAIPGTQLATYLASVPSGLPETLKYMPEDAMVLAAARVGDTTATAEWISALMKQMAEAGNAAPEEAAGMAQAMKNFTAAFGDDVSMAWRPGQGINIVEAVRLKDAEAARQYTKDMNRYKDVLSKVYHDMGSKMSIETTAGIMEHKGHQIDEWKYVFDFTLPEGADAQQAMMAEQQKKMMTLMYGEAMCMHLTTLGDDWLISMGASSPQPLQALIDGTLPLIMDDAAFRKNVLASVPKESEGLAHIRLTSLIDWAMGMARTMGAPVPQCAFQPGPGVLAILDVDGARASAHIAIPAAEIKAVADGFKTMGQGAAPAQ